MSPGHRVLTPTGTQTMNVNAYLTHGCQPYPTDQLLLNMEIAMANSFEARSSRLDKRIMQTAAVPSRFGPGARPRQLGHLQGFGSTIAPPSHPLPKQSRFGFQAHSLTALTHDHLAAWRGNSTPARTAVTDRLALAL